MMRTTSDFDADAVKKNDGPFLKSKISLSLLDLFILFILRTIICLPVVALMAHLLFF